MSFSTQGSAKHFAYSVLPAHHELPVKLCVARSHAQDTVFLVSQRIICEKSRYFDAQVKQAWAEAPESPLTLNEGPGIVSDTIVECLVQWIYQEKVGFDRGAIEDTIMAAIEVARLAVKSEIYGMGEESAAHIKQCLISTATPESASNENTSGLNSTHLLEETYLPRGHPVRRVMDAASIRDPIEAPVFQLHFEMTSIPSFAVDLLREIRKTLHTSKSGNLLTDPLTGGKIEIPNSSKIDTNSKYEGAAEEEI